MTASPFELLATCLFGVAVLHTFATGVFQRLARRYPEGSVGENFFHLLGEVEIVFALWAGVLVVALALSEGSAAATAYMEGRREGLGLSFTEPLFVFVIMTMAATRPVRELAQKAVAGVARGLPLSPRASVYLVALTLGPLLGSLITEPAAMTVTALLLRDVMFREGASTRLKHRTLAVLFVNVSIGGTLTHFAAPPVVMVAEKWQWGLGFMLGHFGWKAAIAVVVNAAFATAMGYKELVAAGAAGRESGSSKTGSLESGTFEEGKLANGGVANGGVANGDHEGGLPGHARSEGDSSENGNHGARKGGMRVPAWVTVLHLLFLAAVVATSHHSPVFVGIFLFFLGIVAVTGEYQEPLALREGLLVAAFLGGLVVLGTFQKWWLGGVIARLGETALFWGATGLTAVTDNAALTYLGSLVPGLSPGAKYALVAGAVTGGGLTVIANAPNPVGYGILKGSFGDGGFSPARLALSAALPTAVAAALLFGLRAL